LEFNEDPDIELRISNHHQENLTIEKTLGILCQPKRQETILQRLQLSQAQAEQIRGKKIDIYSNTLKNKALMSSKSLYFSEQVTKQKQKESEGSEVPEKAENAINQSTLTDHKFWFWIEKESYEWQLQESEFNQAANIDGNFRPTLRPG